MKVNFRTENSYNFQKNSVNNLPKTNFENTQNQSIQTVSTPLNLHKNYSKISFGRSIEEHKSWGANVRHDKSVNFKLFTFPDAKRVFVEVRRPERGESVADWILDPYNSNETFRSESQLLSENSTLIELKNKGRGVFETLVRPSVAQDGDGYRFVIIDKNDKVIKVKDPYSNLQEKVNSWSTIYDHEKYQWNDSDWMNGRVREKISRYSHENNLANPKSLRIYELNIPTFTKEGTFEAAKEKLTKIAKTNKFNAIEIMPVENTHDINWGYDGVDKFAVQKSVMGGPDKLKELIDHAHSLKLNVIMDIVPNHLGPDGAMLHLTGPYIEGPNDFGSAFNFERYDNKHVRDYIVNTSLNWLRNYHCDGIRADMTKFMSSDYTMKQMATEVHYHHPDAVLIAEDGRNNMPKVTTPLASYEELHDAPIRMHNNMINKIENNSVSLDNLGFDFEWDFPFHKQIAAASLGDWDMSQYHRDMNNLDSAVRNSATRVKYPMSHDEIGNWDGTRLINKYMAIKLDMFNRLDEQNDTKKGQKTAHVTQNLIKVLVSGDADRMSHEEWSDFQQSEGIIRPIALSRLKSAFSEALDIHKTAVGKVYSIPGPKMIFQGDESADPSYFKFFRLFSSGEEPYLRDKGYEPGLPAFYDSKLESVPTSNYMASRLRQVENWTNALNDLVDKNESLQRGEITSTRAHSYSNVHAVHTKLPNNEIFSVSNHSDYSYNGDYRIRFPKGKWQEVLTSNDRFFGGDGKFINTDVVVGDNENKMPISLAANSITFFKRID